MSDERLMADEARTPLPLRPGVSDFACALLLVLASFVAVYLEPAHAYFWRVVPLSAAGSLMLAAGLLAVGSRTTTTLAMVVHFILLVPFGLAVLLSMFFVITIVLFGLGFVLLPPSILLLANSLFTLSRIRAARRAERLSPTQPLHQPG